MNRRQRRLSALRRWADFVPVIDAALAGDWERSARRLRRLDETEFLDFLAAQDAGLSFAYRMSRDGATSQFPASLLLHLRGLNGWWQRRRADLMEALEEFHQGAAGSSLPFLLIKGWHFAVRFHGSLDARWTRDLDVLVKRSQLSKAERLLSSLGYRSDQPVAVPAGLHRRLIHASTWTRGDVSIDLHHALRVRPGYSLDAAPLFQRSESLTMSHLDLQVPGAADSLVVLLLTMLSDLEQGRSSARSLFDLHAALALKGGAAAWGQCGEWSRMAGFEHGFGAILGAALAVLPQSRPADDTLQRLVAFSPRHLPDRQRCLELWSAESYGLANRRWFLESYGGSRAAYYLWWLVGGLFRPGSIAAWWRERVRN